MVRWKAWIIRKWWHELQTDISQSLAIWIIIHFTRKSNSNWLRFAFSELDTENILTISLILANEIKL